MARGDLHYKAAKSHQILHLFPSKHVQSPILPSYISHPSHATRASRLGRSRSFRRKRAHSPISQSRPVSTRKWSCVGIKHNSLFALMVDDLANLTTHGLTSMIVAIDADTKYVSARISFVNMGFEEGVSKEDDECSVLNTFEYADCPDDG